MVKPNIKQIEDYLKKGGASAGEVDALLEPIKQLTSQRRYGLVWEEPTSGSYDAESVEKVLQHHYPFLKEEKNKVIALDQTKPNNLLIEGDNLHALQALQYTHHGKVDVIYIDPPYNTGNKDFVYNDRFVDAEDSWRHSSWLSFMNKRLRLARELMSDDGVIFISIDDNEMAQLKLLCDQIFGEQNFVGTIIQDKGNAQNDAQSLQKNHEYILTYQKKEVSLRSVTEELVKVHKDENGYWYRGSGLTTGGDKGTLNARPNLGYTIYYNEQTGDKIAVKDYDVNKARISNDEEEIYSDREDLLAKGYKKIRPPKKGALLGRWTWSIEKFNQGKNLIGINKTKTGYSVYQKNYVEHAETDGTVIYSREEITLPSKSILKYPTSAGTKSLVDVLGYKVFNNPKNTEMIKYLIALYPSPNALILDFFAGSGTTGHAVMELNKEDGGNRQFILCTNNEVNADKEIEQLVELGHVEAFSGRKRTKKHKAWVEEFNQFKESETYADFLNSDTYKDLGIARAVTYERLKRVINGYTTPKGKDVEGIANNLRYFTVELKKASQDEAFDSYRLIKDTVDIIRIKEDLYADERWEILDGIDVVHLEDKQKVIRVVLDADVIDEDVEAVLETFEEDGKEHKIYTSYTGHLDYGNVTRERLPEEILKAIRRKSSE